MEGYVNIKFIYLRIFNPQPRNTDNSFIVDTQFMSKVELTNGEFGICLKLYQAIVLLSNIN